MRVHPSPSLLGALLLATLLAPACRGDAPSEAAAPAGLKTKAVATALPSGASVVVSGYDLEGFWSRLQGSRLYQELNAIPDVRQAFAPLAQSQQEFEAETGLPLNEETVMTLFGQKFDIGFYGPLAGDRADLLLVAQVQDEEQARQILQSLETRVASEQGAAFRETEYGGLQVRVATTGEGEDVLFYALGEGHLTMATTQPRIQQAIDLRGDGDEAQAMSQVEDYVAALGKLPDAAIAVYVDQLAVQEAARRAAADTAGADAADESLQQERLRAATSALEGVELARSIAAGVYWTEAGIRGDLYARFPEGPRSEMATMLTRDPAPIRTIAFQPVGTLLYGAINSLDAQVVYEQVRRTAIDATRIQIGVKNTPDSLRGDSLVVQQLEAFERETGIDVEEDLIAWVGSEAAVAIAGVDKSGFFPLPETALTISTKDRARSQAFFTEVEGLVAEMALTRASIPLTWQSEEYEGQTIRYAPTPMGEGLSLAYSVMPDFVLVATSRGLLKRMMDARGGRAQALPSNPGFSTMTEFYATEVNALGFVNLEQIMTEAQSLMSTFGAMAGGGASAADTTATPQRVLAALKNAPRLGFYSDADGEGVFGHFLLEVR